MITSSGYLIDALRLYGLLPRERLDQVAQLAGGRCSDARALARILLTRGWFNVYQINQILHGNARDLVHGPYVVTEKLGQGGLSQVFKAQHQVFPDWQVALKVINPEVIGNVEGQQQFLSEMEAMAQLDHPNIVQFCDADHNGQTCYYAMEYVEGIDLSKYARTHGVLPVGQACDFIRQAALGLQHAHERNIVHRDIKPANLYLIDPKSPGAQGNPSRIKILDWGLACVRLPQSLGGGSSQVARGIVGTADYLSPDQARNADAVDIRSDIYSLGCTFYFLLTGRPPFPDGTLMQKLIAHQRTDPPAVESLRGDVSPTVAQAVRRMMAKQPGDRFQTPAAVALALSACTDSHSGMAHPALPCDEPGLEHTLIARAVDTVADLPCLPRTAQRTRPC